MANDLALRLKIEALVKGAKEVQALANDLGAFVRQTKQPAGDPTKPLRDNLGNTRNALRELKQEIIGLFALGQIRAFVTGVVQETARAEAAFKGLEAVANFTGIGIGRAFQEAQKLAADGLLTLGDASKALQNLLARGFALDEAVQIVKVFKDFAAFNRQASLSMSEAVVSATEGLKNENSILVDNVGLTKNVSVLWKEYGASVGKTGKELEHAQKLQAEFQGILREGAIVAGNAERALGTFQGRVAQMNKTIQDFKIQLGDELLPVLADLANAGRFLIENFVSPLVKGVKVIGAAVGAAVAELRSLQEFVTKRLDPRNIITDPLNKRGLEDLKELGRQLEAHAKTFREQVDDIILQSAPKIFTPDRNARLGRGRSLAGGGPDTGKPEDLTAELLAVQRAQIEAQVALQREGFERQRADLEHFLEQNIVGYQEYYESRTALEVQAIDAQIAALRKQLEANAAIEADAKEKMSERLKAGAEVIRLEGEISALTERRRTVQVLGAREAAQAERELADELARVREELADLTGAATPADRRAAIERQFRTLLERANAAGDAAGAGAITRLIDVRANLAELREFESQYTAALTRMRAAEQSIEVQRKSGLLSETEARRQLIDLHQRTAGEVEQLIPRMEALARAIGDPDAIARLAQLRAEIAELRVVVDETAQAIDQGAIGALADTFRDIGREAKDAGEVVRDFFDDLLRRIQDILAQRFAERIFEGLFGAAGGASGIGAFFSQVLGVGHTGGIVGQLVPRRRIDLLPRFHSGGIVGGDERLIVARKGEEILTEDDPRHRNNAGGVVVNVIEAPGTRAQVATRQDQGGMTIDVLIEQLEGALAQRLGRGQGTLDPVLQRVYGVNRTPGTVR